MKPKNFIYEKIEEIYQYVENLIKEDYVFLLKDNVNDIGSGTYDGFVMDINFKVVYNAIDKRIYLQDVNFCSCYIKNIYLLKGEAKEKVLKEIENLNKE